MATAAAVGPTGAILLPTASAHTVTHTLAFTSVPQATTQFSKTARASDGKDVSKAAKVIGYDVCKTAVTIKYHT